MGRLKVWHKTATLVFPKQKPLKASISQYRVFYQIQPQTLRYFVLSDYKKKSNMYLIYMLTPFNSALCKTLISALRLLGFVSVNFVHLDNNSSEDSSTKQLKLNQTGWTVYGH